MRRAHPLFRYGKDWFLPKRNFRLVFLRDDEFDEFLFYFLFLLSFLCFGDVAAGSILFAHCLHERLGKKSVVRARYRGNIFRFIFIVGNRY